MKRLNVSIELRKFDYLRDVIEQLCNLGFLNIKINVPVVTIYLWELQIPEAKALLTEYWSDEHQCYRFAELQIKLESLS